MRILTTHLRAGGLLLAGAALLGAAASPTPAVAAGRAVVTTELNVRSGPGTDHRVVGSLPSGRTVTTLASNKGWSTISYQNRKAYVSNAYLDTVRSAPATTAVSSGSVKLSTTAVNLRRGAGRSHAVLRVVPRGTRLTATGKVAAGYAEVLHRGTRGWVSRTYLRNTGGLPTVTGTRVATAALNLRTGSGAGARAVGEVARGTRLEVTGVVHNGRAQVVYRSAVRWVTARYLSTSAPPAAKGGGYAVERGLKPNAVKVHRAARAAFPQIRTYYGVRPDAIPDHPSGRALDLMIPNYRTASGRALGQQLATWARRNARNLGIQYVIWNQRIWNIERDREGWRPMASRGNDSANHKDHVHITVYS